jgi:hypothetical protein
MLPENENILDVLKQVLIFNEFSEDELAEVEELLNTEFVTAGEIVFSQGDESDNVYIILDGEVRVTRQEKDGSEIFLAYFDTGDIFGEDGLVLNRPRSATITALTDTELLYLNKGDFQRVRDTYPQIEPYLVAFTRTHEAVRKLKIRWLNEDEAISLVAQRHPISMLIEIAVTAFLVSLTLTILMAFFTFLRDVRVVTILSAGTAGVVTLIGLTASIWSFFEWRNDYFFVTNLRVVWRERILFRSSSRQEVPLRRIQSLNVLTPNVFARMINVGVLSIRTFNSEMRLTDVNHPERMKKMIDSFLYKYQRKSIRSEHAAIRRTIRRQLGYNQPDDSPIDQPTEDATLRVQEKRQRFTIFKTRVVEEGSITYRKHWWIFFKRAWKPSILLILTLVASFGFTITILSALGVIGLFLVYSLTFIVFIWWLYQYADWRNDIYRVTQDRIIDRDKKPLGKESFRSAPINNIQSVGHEIPNTIGLILNVGNVKINVGEEILTFDGVHNPALVHQDISRRMEELAAETDRQRSQQEHARMAAWLEIYHDETRGDFDSGPMEHIPEFE